MPRILITGICSFTGRHLTAYLLSLSGYEVFGVDLMVNSPPKGANVELGDVSESGPLFRVLDAVRPDAVYHLAASTAEADPGELIRTNVEGTWHLLHACRQLPRPPKILVVGSAAGFGEMAEGMSAWRDDAPMRPSSFYGLSRATQLELGRVAFEKWGLPIYLCRPFNLVGSGLSERFAPAALARRVLELKQSGRSRFSLRNPHTVRDFVDVRDAIRAYHVILEHGQPGQPYNVGSGVGVEVCILVEKLAALAGVSLEIEEECAAPVEVRSTIQRSVADITRLRADTGWLPRIPLEQSLREMLNH